MVLEELHLIQKALHDPLPEPSSEETFTLLLTLDPSFNCPHLLSCRDNTTASGQVSLLQV